MRPVASLLPLPSAAAGLADPLRFARWRAAGRDAAAAGAVPAGDPAYSRLHAPRAEACLGQALAARAPGAARPASPAAPLFDRAAEGHAAALASSDAAGAPALNAGLAQALPCRAELDAPDAAARHAAAPAGWTGWAALHGARAAPLLTRIGPAAGRCAAARRALALSAAAPAEHQALLGADAALPAHRFQTCEPPR